MKSILAFVTSCLAAVALGQNLVPNPSFEEYTTCPWNWGQWANVVGWTSPYTTSADYFNACAAGGAAGIPFNNMGYQYPAEGQAYMGIVTYKNNGADYRELIAADLEQALLPGVPVYLSFKVAVGGFGTSNINSANYTSKGVGIKFFNDFPSSWYDYMYPNQAAVYLQEVITDTAVWMNVCGSYIPDSSYTRLVIGNFFADSLSAPELLDSTGYGILMAAYVFVDEVCVSYDPSYCCSGHSGVSDRSGDLSIVLFPNPFSSYLRLQIDEQSIPNTRIQIFDTCGREIESKIYREGGSGYVIDGSNLSAGAYRVVITETNGVPHTYSVMHLSP